MFIILGSDDRMLFIFHSDTQLAGIQRDILISAAEKGETQGITKPHKT